MQLSVVIITKNAASTLEGTLRSVKALECEIVVVDDQSTDSTVIIARRYGAKVWPFGGSGLSAQRQQGLKKARYPWVLALDADEQLSTKLVAEIKAKLTHPGNTVGYIIPFANHFLGKPVLHGGENYTMLRLFRKDQVRLSGDIIHEHYQLKKGTKSITLKHPIIHHSYRSLSQTFKKFTQYAKLEAARKITRGETAIMTQLITYPLHMLWARFIKDKGYKDGLFRLPLDIGFAYMEWLTYVIILFKRKR